LDFLPPGLDFLPPDLDFLPSGLEFLPSGLEILPRGLARRRAFRAEAEQNGLSLRWRRNRWRRLQCYDRSSGRPAPCRSGPVPA
jgi:hypothetical protein